MFKRYQIELDRNERDFATFLRSRDVTLSKNDLRVLIASQAVEDQVSLFEGINHSSKFFDMKQTTKKKNLKNIKLY